MVLAVLNLFLLTLRLLLMLRLNRRRVTGKLPGHWIRYSSGSVRLVEWRLRMKTVTNLSLKKNR